jgi:transglutaminase-like putative cysteine protease
MLFAVKHATLYSYSRPIFLDPQIFRLRPRSDGTQRLICFTIQIEPQPAGMTECADLAGNATLHAWFTGTTDRLRVSTAFEIETLRSHPFDYIITDPRAETLPVEYSQDIRLVLAPYRAASSIHESVCRFAAAIAKETNGSTSSFLVTLARRLFDSCNYVVREEGAPQPAAVTLASRRGSCRDLAVMFIEACRSQGIAARFVSGYHAGQPSGEKLYLHAWAEVYLPGGGWRGYDPAHGLAVSDQHIVLAAGYSPALAAPVTGFFRGTGVSTNMRADISIRRRPARRPKKPLEL